MILPRFRQKTNEAESTEDLKKTFVLSVMEFLENAFEGGFMVGYEDINFTPYEEPYFLLSQRLLEDERIQSLWKDSDLHQIIERLAESAANRYKRLEKHREKTNAKIRMNIHQGTP
jgi:hypothetical protein